MAVKAMGVRGRRAKNGDQPLNWLWLAAGYPQATNRLKIFLAHLQSAEGDVGGSREINSDMPHRDKQLCGIIACGGSAEWPEVQPAGCTVQVVLAGLQHPGSQQQQPGIRV